MSDEKMKLPPGERAWSEAQTTVAQTIIDEPADDDLGRSARRGVGRVVRDETVHHYRQSLVVKTRPSKGDVALVRSFQRFDRRAPFQESTTIGMTVAEARIIGRLLLAAADDAEAPSAAVDPQDAGAAPNTASNTSEPPVSASSKVSESGSTLSANSSAKNFSEARRNNCALVRRSASVGSLISSVLINSRKIASTAICLPKAKSSLFGSRILSSMVTRHLHGSRPGEAVELRAHGLTCAWPVAPAQGAAA